MKLKMFAVIATTLLLAASCKKKDQTAGNSTPTVTALNCAAVSFSSVATAGTAFAATATLPYTGGNAKSYSGGYTITSTGVTGLTATLLAGTLANGAGNLTFNVSGTPSAAGAAVFAVTFGGQTCSYTMTVNAGGATTPSITSLDCGNGTFSTVATVGVAYTATATIPYMGGNGLAYASGSAIASTGVIGLTATLVSGTLANGAGNFSFTVTGTATTAGTASFPFSFSGQNCNIQLTVNPATPPSPAVTALNCASVTYSGTATVAVPFSATATVPYTGGNGVAYTAGTAINSTGVTGLTATLAVGTLASGAGNLTYNVSGTGSAAGTAMFALSFGGQNCSIALTVNAPGCTTPAVFTSNYRPGVTITSTCTSVILKSNGTPDHVTPYWGVGHAMYEAQLPGHTVNPGSLQAQNFTMTIPVSPAIASTHEETALGPIGMALNGVAIFNDREGGNVPLDPGVLLSFDRGGAHSGPGGLYHYHVSGDFTTLNDAKLIGFLRDGFPIYGRKDTTGVYPTLDVYGGHFGPTQNYPAGIYHYHTSNVNYQSSGVYILKAGAYYGTKGTFVF